MNAVVVSIDSSHMNNRKTHHFNSISTMAESIENNKLRVSDSQSTSDCPPPRLKSCERSSTLNSIDGYMAGLDCDMQLTSSFGGHLRSLELSDRMFLNSSSWTCPTHSLSGLTEISIPDSSLDSSSWKYHQAHSWNGLTEIISGTAASDKGGDGRLGVGPLEKNPLNLSEQLQSLSKLPPFPQPNLTLPSTKDEGGPGVATKRANGTSIAQQEAHNPRQVIPELNDYIDHYNEFDVICGRGERTNRHPGNKFYLKFVRDRKPLYCGASRDEKGVLVLEVLNMIRKRGGRILDLDKATKRWYVLHEKRARTKVTQALRDKNASHKKHYDVSQIQKEQS